MQIDLATKNALIYIRVSSEEQVENFSLDTQQEICQKEAIRRGYKVLEVFREEGKSAKTITGRPELMKLLEFCRRNRKSIDAVFVYRIDRISRQTSDYLAIRKRLADYNISIISANEPTGNSPTEKLLETIIASFAQHDNDVRSERTKNGMRARFLSGLCTGKVPIGYIMENGYALKDKNFDKMKNAWDLMATGTKSLTEMAQLMNSWGIRKVVSGKEYKLRAQTVDRLFRNKFYIGILTSKTYPDEVKGQHTPMITEEQFYKVQAIIDGRNISNVNVAKRTRDNSEFPLRRIIRCSKCDSALTGAWTKGRTGKKYAYYFCKSRCGAPSLPVKFVDDSLIDFLKEITPKKSSLDLFLFLLRKTFNKNLAQLRAKSEKAEFEIQQLKALRKTLVQKNLAGIYSDEIYLEQNKDIEDKITTAQIVLNATTFDRYNIDDIETFMREKFKNLGETYRKSNLSERRVLIVSIAPKGLHWQYSGYSKQEIGSLYQAILDIEKTHFAFGDPSGNRTRDFRDESP